MTDLPPHFKQKDCQTSHQGSFSQSLTGSTVAPPAQALAVCREVTRTHSKTFYLGSRFFPHKQRLAVWAVYAACRLGDDIADEGTPQQAAQGLLQWWEDIDAAYLGKPQPTPMSQALAWAVQHFDIPQSAFAELCEGLQMDLQGHEYHSMNDLLLYCRRVAGVVGFMISPISGYSGGAATLQQALILGQAMQLTNILRDVGEDLRRGRVYLPADLMQHYGVSRADLERQEVTPEYRALMQHLVQLAREWYRQGAAGIPKLHGPARLAVGVAAYAYEGILDDLERADYNNFSRRAYVRRSQKWLMLPRVWWDMRGQSLVPKH